MRTLAALAIALAGAGPSAAQWQPMPTPAPVRPAPLVASPYGWNPVAEYVEPGQDEPGYRAWIARQPWRAYAVAQFHRYLVSSGVSYVAPTWQLLRTASDWRRCGADPFEIPPAEEWPNIVNTLRYVRDHVVPRIGPVEPVSVFRNAVLNRCAGGAPESVHQSMSAIDFVPLTPIERDAMIRRLCSEHQAQGPRFNAGLGFYSKMRFHVDSWRYRTWGRNDHGHVACPRVEAPVILAGTPATGETASGTAGSTTGSPITAVPTTTVPTPVTTIPVPVAPVTTTPVVASPASTLPPAQVSSVPASKDPLAPL